MYHFVSYHFVLLVRILTIELCLETAADHEPPSVAWLLPHFKASQWALARDMTSSRLALCPMSDNLMNMTSYRLPSNQFAFEVATGNSTVWLIRLCLCWSISDADFDRIMSLFEEILMKFNLIVIVKCLVIAMTKINGWRCSLEPTDRPGKQNMAATPRRSVRTVRLFVTHQPLHMTWRDERMEGKKKTGVCTYMWLYVQVWSCVGCMMCVGDKRTHPLRELSLLVG